MTATLEIYRDKRGHWRWRLRHQNGRIIAASTEGYKNKADMWSNVELILCGWEVDDDQG